jgi:hypothetical protein
VDELFWYDNTRLVAATHGRGMFMATVNGTSPPPGALSRTYVASFGSDANTANSCDFAHPCRTFQTAFSYTLTGGEILAVDGSGYGPISIDRSVSLIANPGVFAGIGVFSGAGVYINTAGVNVVLRGLTFNGQGGNFGVNMTNGTRLSIENCVFAGFTGGAAINVQTAATVRVINTLARDGGNGVYLDAGAAASISGSQFVGNSGSGIFVNAGASATVSDSMAARNAYGLNNNAGTLKSLGNNNVTDNTTADTNGTITAAPASSAPF